MATYPIMADMVLQIKFSGTTSWVTVGDGVTSVSPSTNEGTQDFYFMNGGGSRTTFKQGMQRQFAISGIRALGDDFQDTVFAYDFKFGQDRTVSYRWYNSKTNAGETGEAEIIINSDGNGDANAKQSIDISIMGSGTPTEYTHSPA